MILPAVALILVQAAPVAPAVEAKPKKPAKICRTLAMTASRLGARKECRTAEDWAAIDGTQTSGEERLKRRAGGQ